MRTRPRQIEVPAVAISVRQPWADRILSDGKDIENRTWKLPEKYTGVAVALHASKQHDTLSETAKLTADRYGVLVGVVWFQATVTEWPSPWFFGPYGWPVREAVAFIKPMPAKGALGFWTVPDHLAGRMVRRSRW